MKKELILKIKEALVSVLPVTLIVIILNFTPLINFSLNELIVFIISSIFLILGIGLFNLGADLAMTPMGSHIGSGLTKSKKLGILLSVSFALGFFITIAEPDLSVLAKQVEEIMNGTLLIVFVGIGVGLVFKKGGSTGGFDIPCLMISKKFKISVDKVVFVVDATIVAASAFIVGLVPALVGVISAYLCGVMIDKVIINGHESFMIHILSEKHEEINYFINYKMERGTTYVHGQGGYTAQDKKIIEVVIGKREYYTLKKEVHNIDSNAFMIVLNARDVFGYGFRDYHKENLGD